LHHSLLPALPQRSLLRHCDPYVPLALSESLGINILVERTASLEWPASPTMGEQYSSSDHHFALFGLRIGETRYRLVFRGVKDNDQASGFRVASPDTGDGVLIAPPDGFPSRSYSFYIYIVGISQVRSRFLYHSIAPRYRRRRAPSVDPCWLLYPHPFQFFACLRNVRISSMP